MLELKMTLESTDLPDQLICCVDVILVLISVYPETLNPVSFGFTYMFRFVFTPKWTLPQYESLQNQIQHKN